MTDTKVPMVASSLPVSHASPRQASARSDADGFEAESPKGERRTVSHEEYAASKATDSCSTDAGTTPEKARGGRLPVCKSLDEASDSESEDDPFEDGDTDGERAKPSSSVRSKGRPHALRTPMHVSEFEEDTPVALKAAAGQLGLLDRLPCRIIPEVKTEPAVAQSESIGLPPAPPAQPGCSPVSGKEEEEAQPQPPPSPLASEVVAEQQATGEAAESKKLDEEEDEEEDEYEDDYDDEDEFCSDDGGSAPASPQSCSSSRKTPKAKGLRSPSARSSNPGSPTSVCSPKSARSGSAHLRSVPRSPACQQQSPQSMREASASFSEGSVDVPCEASGEVPSVHDSDDESTG